jgi:hypothetical protein
VRVVNLKKCFNEKKGRNEKLTHRLNQMNDLIMLLEQKRQEVTLLQIQVDKLMTNDKNLQKVIDI